MAEKISNLLRYKRKQKYILIDTETESVNLKFSRPWEIGFIIFDLDKAYETQVFYPFWEDLKVSSGAKAQTKFDYNKYKNNAEDRNLVLKSLIQYLSDEDIIIVGHNFLNFDIYQIKNLYDGCNVKFNYSTYLNRIIDTNCLAKTYFLEEYNVPPFGSDEFLAWQFKMINFRQKGLKTNLTHLSKHFNIHVDENKTHSALYDIMINRECFIELIKQINI